MALPTGHLRSYTEQAMELDYPAPGLHGERRKREKLALDVERCYRMLLSEPDTKGALFKAENILREALAEQKVGASRTAHN